MCMFTRPDAQPLEDRAFMLAIRHPIRANRDLEWAHSIMTIWLGVWFLMPFVSFSPLFAQAATLLPEEWWGAILAASGVTHLAALWVNGLRWYTPRIRIMALSCSVISYGALAIGVAQVNPGAFGFGFLTAMIAGAFVCAYRAAVDDVHARQKRDVRNGA